MRILPLLLAGIVLIAAAVEATEPGPLPPYQFTAPQEALLDEISEASFRYFVDEAHPVTGLVPDKLSAPDVSSVAAVGFGFAALPIGVERGWIDHADAEELALRALGTLRDSPAQRFGMFAHFLQTSTGGPNTQGFETAVSTIDTALMIAGALVAGQYFEGEVKQIADDLFAAMDWRAVRNTGQQDRIYMIWQPDDVNDYQGSGSFAPPIWDWYSDETLLISLLGIAAPNPDFRLDPGVAMTNWNRPVGSDGTRSFVYSWPGTLFTYTFAQCFYDFTRTGVGPTGEDWFLNTRAAVRSNRDWCRANAGQFATYGENRWGITASSGPTGYEVPGHQPRGAAGNDPFNGTVAPYGAGMAVLWEPEDAVAALAHMRTLVVSGQPLWASVAGGGYGFWDAFNIDAGWVGTDVFGIAQGPMLLCIENARTQLVQDLFHSHPWIHEGLIRAGFDMPVSSVGSDGFLLH